MLLTIITPTVSVLSIGLTYVLGRLQAVQSDKRAAYNEAYQSFYLPFIGILYKYNIWETSFSKLEMRTRHEIFNLIINNIQYMDETILEYMDLLYAHYGAVIAHEAVGIPFEILTPERLDEVFGWIAQSILSRARILAEKLHQPQIGQFALELYLESREEQKNLLKSAALSTARNQEITDRKSK